MGRARAHAQERHRRPEEQGSRAAAVGARRRAGRRESVGHEMGPQESAQERAGEPAELLESGLQLTDHAPSNASEEPADAEAAGAPGGGRCWLCRSSPCCSRAEPGECACGPGAGLTWGPGGGRRAGAGVSADRVQ